MTTDILTELWEGYREQIIAAKSKEADNGK